MSREFNEHDEIAHELAAAIGTPTLRPMYQPIVDLATGDVVAYEALARWSHPLLGEISPDRFIPIAEKYGLVRGLSKSLFRNAAADALDWPEQITLSFNVSPMELRDPSFGTSILSMLAEIGLPPQRLEIELTENAVIEDIEAVRGKLCGLRAAGIRIALDDFGTGYSNLCHLLTLPLDKVKIDRSFVRLTGSGKVNGAIVQALVSIGNGMGLAITAEGIEQSVQRDTLRALGCHYGQGYLFGRAAAAAETASFFFAETPTRRCPQWVA